MLSPNDIVQVLKYQANVLIGEHNTLSFVMKTCTF
jgi:hypothetical protein